MNSAANNVPSAKCQPMLACEGSGARPLPGPTAAPPGKDFAETAAGRVQPLKAPDVVLHAAANLLRDDPSLADRLTIAFVGGPSGWHKGVTVYELK